MLRNYFKIAFRKIWTQRFYAFTNIIGLAIGISSCLLITLLVLDEVSYDSYHDNAEAIYRVFGRLSMNGDYSEFAQTSSLLADALVSEVPEVVDAVRFRYYGARLVRREESVQTFNEPLVTYVDHSLFDIFTFPLIHGDPQTVLTQPNTLVLTATTAEKYFGNTNPVGQTMVLDNNETFVVDGVCEDIPANSHFHYDVFLSLEGLPEIQNDIWLNSNYYTYFLARPNSDAAQLQAKVDAIHRKHADPEMKQFTGTSLEEFEAAGNFVKYQIQPLKSIHLNSDLMAEHEANGNKAYVWIFSAIALFLLLIACINFMNLATASSMHRAKEVGMRKILGSKKQGLIGQFLFESILMSAIAFSIAILLTNLLMPYFNNLTGKDLTLPLFHPLFFVSTLFGIIIVGLLAGSYPAFFLSAFDPLKVIKGNNLKVGSGIWLRRVLVTAQFTISIILMIGTGVIYNQLRYIQNTRIGFDKEHVLVLNAGSYPQSFESLKNQLNALPEVKSSSVTCYLPIAERACRGHNTFWEEGKNPGKEGLNIDSWETDFNYAATFGIELTEGRYFSTTFTTDSTAVVINEAAAEAFGWEDPIGKRLQFYVSPPAEDIATYTVIGVLKNFNHDNLRTAIDPMAITLAGDSPSTISLRFDATTGVENFIQKVQDIWEAGAAGMPFDYSFLDERFNRMYESEQRLGRVFIIFAGLAIFIACLGLFALASFSAERRKKEISIRKVLGASVPNLVGQLSKEFIQLVLIALLIATPIAWYFMQKWLQNFAFHDDIQLWIFAATGILAIGIALLTVSFQSFKTAFANPIDSLRNE